MSIQSNLKRNFQKLKYYLRTNGPGYTSLRAIKYFQFLIKREMEALSKTRSPEIAIANGRLKVVFVGNGLNILWDSIELTKGCGLNTAFNTFGIWTGSVDAEWEVIEHTQFSLKLRITYLSLPLVQTWSISLEDEQAITWQIDMDAQEWLHIDEFRIIAFVNAQYKNWVLNEYQSDFPQLDESWHDLYLGKEPVNIIGVRFPVAGRFLPSLAMENLNQDFLPLIQNLPSADNCHLIGLRYVVSEDRRNYNAGYYHQFIGRIKLFENDKALDNKIENLRIKSLNALLTEKTKAPAKIGRKLKVLLVNLPWQKEGRWGVRAGSRWPHIKAESEGDYLPYPFFLAYATSLLHKYDIEATIIDAIADQMPEDEFLSKISGMNFDYLVTETSIPSYYYDLELLKRIAQKGISIILCGPNSEIYQTSFLKEHSFIDFVLCGEYEFTLLELLQSLQNRKSLFNVAGLIYREEGEIRKNLPRSPFDINLLPWPHRDSLPMHKYIDSPGAMALPCIQIVASRGCPFKCKFCLWPQVMYQGNHYRSRTVKDVVDETEFLVKEKGFKSVYFDDDTFNVGKQRMLSFCREMRQKGLDKTQWAIMARPDLMDEEILENMKKAGLWAIKYGMESTNQTLVNNINKSMDLRKSDKMIRFTQKLGIKTHLTFTFGLPGETKQTIAETIEYVKKINPFSVQFSITTPFPGTQYYRELEKKNFIVSEDLSCYDGNYKSVIRLENLTPEDLEAARENACQVWSKQVMKRRSWIDNARRFCQHTQNNGWGHAVSRVFTYVKKKNEVERKVSDYEKSKIEENGKDTSGALGACGAPKDVPAELKLPAVSRDILLIQCPPWDTAAPPLGIAYLSGFIKQHGFQAEVFDLNIALYNQAAKNDKYFWDQKSYDLWAVDDLFNQTWDKIGPMVMENMKKKLGEVDVKFIGISVNFAGIKVAGELIRLIKQLRPEIKIIVGGWGCIDHHMRSIYPKNLVDVFVIGEGEQTLLEILEHAQSNNGAPRIDGTIFNNIPGYEYRPRQPIMNLDTIPWPNFSEFNLKDYRYQVLPMFSSRGCISRCSFCNDWPLAKPYRSRSAKNIFEEIKYHTQYNYINNISFKDLLCNGNMAILTELCDMIIDSGIKFVWDSQAIPRKEMTYDVLLKLKQTGCTTLIYGIETFSNKVLKRMNKLFTKEIAEQVLKDTYKAGIRAMFNIIVGFPGETEEDFQETMDALDRNQRYIYQIGAISVCLVNGNTPFENETDKFGLVLSEDPKVRAKYWHTADGANTYEIRRRRAEKVIKLVEKMGFEYATKTI